MRKLIVSICSVALLLAGTGSFAGGPKKPGKTGKRASRLRVEEKTKEGRGCVRRGKLLDQVTSQETKARNAQRTNSDLLQNHERVDRSNARAKLGVNGTLPRTNKGVTSPTPQKVIIQQGKQGTFYEQFGLTEEEFQALNAQQQKIFFQQNYGRSVLAIPNVAVEKDPSLVDLGSTPAFSMTLITEEGELGLGGVIATHTIVDEIAEADTHFGINKEFVANILLPDGTTVPTTWEIVQVASHNMYDISLAIPKNLSPEIASLLQPLKLRKTPVEIGELMFSPSFAKGKATIMFREVENSSFRSIEMRKIPLIDSMGFCGSPWIYDGEVAYVNIGPGSVSSYAVHASYISKLIEAYHHDGKANVDLILDGQKLTTLNIDEYISAFALLDGDWNVIYKEDGLGESTFSKYSQRRIHNAIKERPQGKYLVFHSRTPFWEKTEQGNEFLVEDRSIVTAERSHLREHVYDLVEKEIVFDAEFGTGHLILQDLLDGKPIE